MFVGDDWSEDHHDLELQDHEGNVLARRRLEEGVAGIGGLHELIGEHSIVDPAGHQEPPQVVVGIETDRGPWVQALLAAGYQVYAVNPLSVARYRERHVTSGAKSDPGDAHVLADLVRTDRHRHRPVASDSELAEAVKVLAGISVDYVVRLEQARGPQPSEQVLTALCRALRLETDERDHVFHLAGTPPPHSGQIDLHVRPSVLRLIDRFHDLPALVISAKGDVLAWNAMSSALHGDWSRLRPERRNQPRLRFLPDPTDPPRSKVGDTPDERAATAAQTVAHLRSVAGRYPDDAGLARLLQELHDGSAEFRELWASADAGGWRSHTKTVTHPTLGRVTLECDTLHVPDVDQRLLVYSAAPGSPAAEALALLRVVGTQDLTTAR